jgi:hypothetical protein
MPSLDVFVDVIKLRSGQYWEQELRKEIPRNDVFYLFWSRHAMASTWVDPRANSLENTSTIHCWPI